METNFTPLDIHSMYPKSGEKETASNALSNTILMALATITVLVIAVVLFVIFQKQSVSHAYRQSLIPVISLVSAFHG